jgi:hypothetical protein
MSSTRTGKGGQCSAVSQRYHSSLHDFDKVNYLPRTPSGPQVAQDRPRAGWLTTERQTVPYVWVHPDEER